MIAAPALCPIDSAHAGPPGYTLGVYPALPLPQLEGIFSPLASEISLSLGRRVRFQSSSTYEKYFDRVKKGEFEIALIHPFAYVMFAKEGGYLPLARKNEDMTAIIVVPEDSPIRSVKELEGKTIAMPPVEAAVTYLAKAALAQAGLGPDKVTLRHFEGHQSAIQQILIGGAQASCTCRAIKRIFEARMGVKLRVLMESPPIPHTIIVVHSRVPAEERAAIKNTLLKTLLPGVSPELRAGFIVGDKRAFIEATDSDMDPVREYLDDIGKRP